MNNRYSVPNLERALVIIEFLSKQPEGCGLSEIAKKLEMPKNSVFRILKTLLMHGYINQSLPDKSYILSSKFLSLGYSALGEINLIEKSLDIMRALRDEVNETVLLCSILGHEGVVMEQVLCYHEVKFVIDVGHRFPLHTAAPGKIILAYMSEKEREGILNNITFEKFNERTITNKKDLSSVLAEAKEKGYAIDCGEEIEGLHCVAAPILNYYGYPVASILITGPSSRISKRNFETIGKIVCENAAKISQRLGYFEKDA